MLQASLDSLAGNLQDSHFKHLLSEFPPNKLDLLRKKMHIHVNGLIPLKKTLSKITTKRKFLFIN